MCWCPGSEDVHLLQTLGRVDEWAGGLLQSLMLHMHLAAQACRHVWTSATMTKHPMDPIES